MVEVLPGVEGFRMLKPIYISVIEKYGDYVACVPAANLNASGDTRAEAIYNLQDIVAGTYRLLQKEPRLGPEAECQKEYLESHLVEFSNDNEIKQLRQWVADLQSGICVYCGYQCETNLHTHINCRKCGHGYSMATTIGVLRKHVKNCPGKQ